MKRGVLRIGITQRRIAEAPGAWARDALDAYWNEWVEIQWPNSRFLAIPNFADPSHAVRHVTDWQVDLLILSGGEDVGASPVRDAVERALLNHARALYIPVLGVCRGMQFLHLSDGGTLVRRPGHAGSPHALVGTQEQGDVVNSWHHWCIESTVLQWRALACAPDGTVEAMKHSELPWLGVMWHPERPGGTFPGLKSWIDHAITTIRRQA